ncbi:hypothetical protein V1511DRAFT_522667 [Dipodascopsis uninucleata]
MREYICMHQRLQAFVSETRTWNFAFAESALTFCITVPSSIRYPVRHLIHTVGSASATSLLVSGSFDAHQQTPEVCRDPFRQPGYLQINQQDRRLTKWIPFFSTNILSIPAPESAKYPADKVPSFTDHSPPEEILDSAPTSWFYHLQKYYRLIYDINKIKNAGGKNPIVLTESQQELVKKMNWLHNRRAVVLGDSVDRIMIQFFCEELNLQPEYGPGGQHTTYSCHIPLLNTTIYHWHVASLYPMRPDWWWLKHIKLVAFEDRFASIFDPDWSKVIGCNGQTPDLVLFQSGLWDERAFRESTRNIKDASDYLLTPDELEKKRKNREKTGLGREGRQLSWDELMFFKARMEKFMSFIKDKFHGTPLLYRGLTTRRDSNIADLATINMDRISRALAASMDIEIFEWARLTTAFSDQFLDYLHVGKGPLSYTWANMFLYYLFRATGGEEYNGKLLKFPDAAGNYVKEGEGAKNVTELKVKETPDFNVTEFWDACHQYNVHWGGR